MWSWQAHFCCFLIHSTPENNLFALLDEEKHTIYLKGVFVNKYTKSWIKK